MRHLIIFHLAILVGVILSDSLFAQKLSTVTVGNTQQLQRAASNAKPGTRILIAPGTYRGGLSFRRLRGAIGKPIILAAQDAKRPPVFKGGNSGFQFSEPAYLELHDLIITGASGNGLNIDDGSSFETPAHHILLRNLVIRDIGPKGNRDGIKLSGVDQFRVENCTLERWGTGGSAIDMVGCHDGVVSGCTFRYNDRVFANGVQTKGGSRDIKIQKCRFEHCGNRGVNIGGSTGLQYFRPKLQGYEAKDITVEDCTFIGGTAAVAFVGVDGAIVRNNTIYKPTRWVMRILQENQQSQFVPCRNGAFTNNIVVFHSNDVRTLANIGGGTNPKTFQFSKNVWYCLDRPQVTERIVRTLPTKESGGVYGRDSLFEKPEKGNLKLKRNSPVRFAGPRNSGND